MLSKFRVADALFRKVAAHPVSRAALAGSLAAARSDLIDKYIPLAWENKKYLYVEVSRVQRLSLPTPEITSLLRLLVMLRPAAYLFTAPSDTPEKDTGYTPLQEQYVQKILPGVAALLTTFPAPLVQQGLRAALPFPATPSLEAASRLAAVFCARGRSLVPSLVVDRGAATPDKSWFNIARRNARWHGLDQRMLDELYTLAAENRL